MESTSSSSLGLTKVVLYKHGIGYFERRGKVQGPTKINLVCEASEIDDMLKSLFALAGGGKRIDAVTYDSSKSLQNRLEEFGFNISLSEGLSGLLAQMKGIPVTLSVSGETVSGRVLGLDSCEQIVNERIVREDQLTIYTPESSFKRIALSSITAIQVDDENMAAELKQQLELLFQNAKKKDRKALSVAISDPGEHELLIAYSIPCPIWKTSYRLLMKDSKHVLLQGMAIVDNTQEEDWKDVQIVLVSASPISFIQPLYFPIQPKRPLIAAQGNASTGPVLAERSQRRAEPVTTGALKARVAQAPVPAAAPMAAMAPGAAGGGWGSAEFVGSYEQSSATDMMEESFAETISVETGEKGELFEYRINRPVTIPRNSSALIPIVQQDIEGERISLYNERKNAKFPHAAIKFINNTGLTLEGGPVTVMEGDIYAGEALLDTVKPDDQRFLMYAVDQSCPVVVRQENIQRPYWRARAMNGVIYVDYRICNQKRYELDNLSEQKKVVFVEHPISQGWKLVSDTKPDETTQNFYRFKLEIDAKKSASLVVSEETETAENIWISDPSNVDTVKIKWLSGQNFIDESFQAFLKKLLELRLQVQSLQGQLAQQQHLLQQYTNDQARARENLKTLGANNERYRKIIDSSEDQITVTNKQISDINSQVYKLNSEYREFIRTQLESDLQSAEKKKGK